MIDKTSLEIGDELKHRILGMGVFTETCYTLEQLNADPSSIFLKFPGEEEKEVSLHLCDIVEFEVPRLCQKCMRKLKDKEFNICTSCAKDIQAKLVPSETLTGGRHGR